MKKTHYINGEWVSGQGEQFNAFCPATGTSIWQGCEASLSQIEQAVEASHNALGRWKALTLSERMAYLSEYKSALEKEKEALALAISMDAGKPLWESKTEVAGMIGKLAASIDAYNSRTASKISKKDALETRLVHRPHGVVIVLGPYNFPGHLPNGQIVPALLAGNTVVFKPSEHTPLVAEKMIQCIERAGIPKGVVNLTQGGASVGRGLLNQAINGVFFTGSFKTGKKIHEQFAGRPEIILALEMGGNNPLIVDEVKDINAAVFNTLMSAYITAGQRCTCARRLLVPDNAFGETFLAELIRRANALTVEPYTHNPEPFMGAVITNGVAMALLEKQVNLKSLGGKTLLSMRSKGEAILTPGLLDVSEMINVPDEEIFGPLLTVMRYKDMKEAVLKANQTDYGLSAGILTENAEHADYFYDHIQAGIVNINRQLTGAAGTAPFGGIGKSGNHRPAAFYASDFCAYPMASMVSKVPFMPKTTPQGMNW